jgi:hypothetical protein
MTLSQSDVEELEAARLISVPRKVGARSTIYSITDPIAFEAWVAERKGETDDKTKTH